MDALVRQDADNVEAARKLLVHWKAEAEAAWDAVKETQEFRTWKQADDARKAKAADVETQEMTLRSRALAVFESTGEVRPCAGVLIRMTTTLKYDDAHALEYCSAHLPGAITFDRKVLDKFLVALNGAGQLPGFAIAERKPQVTIATDLGKALAAGDATTGDE